MTRNSSSTKSASLHHRQSVVTMPATGHHFRSRQNDQHEQHQQQQQLLIQLNSQPSVRNIVGFLDKYDRYEIQELVAQMSSHWLLSLDDVKLPIEHPHGLMSQMAPLNDDNLLLLVECSGDDDKQLDLDYREIHQLIRELTIGIYVLNQYPFLHLKSNVDQSTSCQLPPAYVDTKVGQIMINTDYWLKALWHGD